MEQAFSLQGNQPLTVAVIQGILAKKTSLRLSPDLMENIKSDSLNQEEALTPADIQACAIGLGPETPAELTPLMLILLADFFTRNVHATNSQVVSRILEFFDYEVLPQVYTQGLHASPTAHLLLPVFGAGKVYYQGYLLKAADVHDIFSWQPVPWPERLPLTLTAASFLGSSSLIYCFIQLKKIVSYSQELLPETTLLTNSGNLYLTPLNNLETQIDSFLAHPEAKHRNDLVYQLVKLFTTITELIVADLSQLTTASSFSVALNNPIHVNSDHLLALMNALRQENLFLFTRNFGTHPGPLTSFTNQLMLQPYSFLKNLENISAIATLIQYSTTTNLQNTLNDLTDIRSTYRKQIIDVLQEANFDELIRKTIAFMYARVANK